MTISGGGRGLVAGSSPVFSGARVRWLCADCGGGLVLGVCGALLSEVSEAGH